VTALRTAAATRDADARVAQARSALDVERSRSVDLERRIVEAAEAASQREAALNDAHEKYVLQIRGDQETLRREFQALSAETLKASQEQLLAVAQERLTRERQVADAELAKREQSVKTMVEPIAKALADVQRQTTEADKARAETQATLAEQIRRMLDSSEQLGKQTESLRSALRRPEVRGRWGELHLRRVVEVAGLVNGVDFDEQTSGIDDEGARLRPDMIVTLSGGRRIVVDAKTPLDALLDMEADPGSTEVHAARHVENVRKRVTELGSKTYREQFNSKVDFSVLFLPAESFLQVATEKDPNLLAWAYDRGVIIATPTVLVAMLRTVAHAWREDALAKDAQKVLDTGRELYDRLSKMGEHLTKVGRAIDTAGRTYNDLVGSMERRVFPKAREFAALQQLTADEPTPLVGNTPRLPQARELTAEPGEAAPSSDG